MDVVRHAPPERVRAFYHRWYRPHNMAVVCVGDLGHLFPQAASSSSSIALHNTSSVGIGGGANVLHCEDLLDVIRDNFFHEEVRNVYKANALTAHEFAAQFPLPQHDTNTPLCICMEDSEETESSISVEFFHRADCSLQNSMRSCRVQMVS